MKKRQSKRQARRTSARVPADDARLAEDSAAAEQRYRTLMSHMTSWRFSAQ